MTIKERLDLIIKRLKLSGRQFEKECGLANGSYASLGDRVGADKLNKILTRFPQISADWLLTERGEIFVTPTESDNLPPCVPPAEPEDITISHEILSVLQQQASALLSQQNTISELVRQNGEHILLEQQLVQSKRAVHQGGNAACADVG